MPQSVRVCLSLTCLPLPFSFSVFFWAHRGKCVTWIAKQLNESCRLYISSSDLAVLQSPCPPQACWYVISSGLRAALRLQVTHHHPAGVVLGASVEKATAKYVNTRWRNNTLIHGAGPSWGGLGHFGRLCWRPRAAKHCFVLDRKSQTLVWTRVQVPCSLPVCGRYLSCGCRASSPSPRGCDTIGTSLNPMESVGNWVDSLRLRFHTSKRTWWGWMIQQLCLEGIAEWVPGARDPTPCWRERDSGGWVAPSNSCLPLAGAAPTCLPSPSCSQDFSESKL